LLGRPWFVILLISASQVAKITVWATMPGTIFTFLLVGPVNLFFFCTAGDWTQDLVHARQAFWTELFPQPWAYELLTCKSLHLLL
jgi:hypothetical protein